jgi:hypothetical protein
MPTSSKLVRVDRGDGRLVKLAPDRVEAFVAANPGAKVTDRAEGFSPAAGTAAAPGGSRAAGVAGLSVPRAEEEIPNLNDDELGELEELETARTNGPRQGILRAITRARESRAAPASGETAGTTGEGGTGGGSE